MTMKSGQFAGVLAMWGLIGAAGATAATLQSSRMSVLVDESFPRVLEYRWKDGGSLSGHPVPVHEIRINGTNYTPVVTFEQTSPAAASWKLAVTNLNLSLTVSLSAEANILSLQMDKIAEEGGVRLMTVEFPGQLWVSAGSDEPEASVVFSKIPDADVALPLAERTTAAAASNATHAVVHNNRLAASIYNNVLLDSERLKVLSVASSNHTAVTGIACSGWTYREVQDEIVEPPMAKIMLAPDQNGDRVVDWQDGALAYRAVEPLPYGAQFVPEYVVSQIALNFASWAQHPFLRVLDNIKKVYLHTDGLAQQVQFKGFAAEGHDSSHPDYGFNVGKRQGGHDEFEYTLKRMKDFNARGGIHINVTEIYPEAKNFDPAILREPRENGWAWLDQSYLVNLRQDIVSGQLYRRLDDMRKDLPSLDWVYVDVYYGTGWNARKLAAKINSLGLPMYTEFPAYIERYGTWNHTAVDWTQKVWGDGRKSHLARFIQNSSRDVWEHDPLVRGANNDGFMGWHSQRDYNEVIRSAFTVNLPSKYLQHFAMRSWGAERADFERGVQAVKEDGVYKILRQGKLLDAAKYTAPLTRPEENLVFIPWDPFRETKIYHWNDNGGSTTWTLPDSWAESAEVRLYRLTDTGRKFVRMLPVKDQRVTIDADAKTPYVLYRTEPPALPEIVWGEGTPVRDPGFDSRGFDSWARSAPAGAACGAIEIINDDFGQSHLRMAGGGKEPLEVHQTLYNLNAGQTYSASVWVQLTDRRAATIAVHPGACVTNAALASAGIARTDFTNFSDNSDKYMTRYQRVKVLFDVPKNSDCVTLVLRAEAGEEKSVAEFDDVRVVATQRTDPKGHTFFEDFENVDEGWSWFVYGYKGNMQTHLSEANPPHTQDTIDGKYSLKTKDENPGLNYRSLPHLLPLKAKTQYRIRFDYRVAKDAQYKFVVKSDDAGEHADPMLESTLAGKDLQRHTFTAEFKTGREQDTYIGIMKNEMPGDDKNRNKGELVIDNIAIDEVK